MTVDQMQNLAVILLLFLVILVVLARR